MNLRTILEIFLFGISLSMDSFAICVTDSLVYKDIDKRKSFFIASVFAFMQALLPLIGYWLVELVAQIAGAEKGETAGKIMSLVVTWLSFGLLIIVGFKMIFDGIKDLKIHIDNKEQKIFTIKEVFLFGILTSIDALAVGVSFHSGLSTNVTIWLHVTIILLCTFLISLIGLFLGKKINKLFKGKYSISCIIGGAILLLLAVTVVLTHYLNL